MRDYYEEAREAIRKLFGDTSVPQEDTKRSLQAIKDEIDIYIDTLEV
jgi:hypothetical protein